MIRSILVASLLALSSNAFAANDGSFGDRGDRYGSQERYQERDTRNVYAYDRRCRGCGTVTRIDHARRGSDRGSGAGAVAGALIGAALGNQVGSGDGRRAATVAGAVAGGVAGNRIERSRNRRDLYAVYVNMDDGRRLVVQQRNLDGVREGSRVVVRQGRIYLR